MTPEQKKINLRLAVILLLVALAFGAGFVIRMILLGR